MNIGLYSKNQCDNWTHLGGIADLLFLRALDLFRNSFTDPTKIARLICSFYEYPAVSNWMRAFWAITPEKGFC